MRVLLVTDAWRPQINGVVRSLERMVEAAPDFGARVEMLTPEGFRQIGLPSYPDIRIALASRAAVNRRVVEFQPDHIHIATEGPLGWSTRSLCLRQKRTFTTSYHTRFPQYVAKRWPVPERWSYGFLRRFHGPAVGTMVSTQSVETELRAHGFRNLLRWSRGVDLDLFHPRETSVLDLPRPIFLSVGRVAIEKNLEAFLSLDLPGSKVVVGDGPARAELASRYPAACFLGIREGRELAEIYASADVFVFPSLTDTFGIVLLEAAASGVPIAAFPVPGPSDVLAGSGAGVLDADLGRAALAALRLPRQACLDLAGTYSWQASAAQFFGHMRRIARVNASHHGQAAGSPTAAATSHAAGEPAAASFPA